MKELIDWLIRIVGYAAFAYVVFVVLVYFWQRRLLYYPDVEPPSEQQLQSYGLKNWPSGSKSYIGLVGGDELAPKGTVLIFHGNAGAAWHRAYYSQALGAQGYRVLLAEYPGYGGRKGAISESSFVVDAQETLQLVHQQYGGPIYLWGESLGAGVVSGVIEHTNVPVSGVILLTPWDSLPSLANHYYPLLPTRWLIRDQYNSVENLKMFNGKVAVIVAGSDEIIPNKFSIRLYESITSPKQLWRFEGAGHNSWPYASGETWWQEVMTFVSE